MVKNWNESKGLRLNALFQDVEKNKQGHSGGDKEVAMVWLSLDR